MESTSSLKKADIFAMLLGEKPIPEPKVPEVQGLVEIEHPAWRLDSPGEGEIVYEPFAQMYTVVRNGIPRIMIPNKEAPQVRGTDADKAPWTRARPPFTGDWGRSWNEVETEHLLFIVRGAKWSRILPQIKLQGINCNDVGGEADLNYKIQKLKGKAKAICLERRIPFNE